MKFKMPKKLEVLLWPLLGVFFLALLFARAIVPDQLWLLVLLSILLVADLSYLIYENRKSLKTRTAAFGFHSFVTVILVFCLVGVLNFLVSRYPFKLDLTENKLHTLGDQTRKVMKTLNQDVNAVFFSKGSQRDQYKALLENYGDLNTKFKIEYVDPDREPTRVKAAGVKKYNTLVVNVGDRSNKIEEPNEEKLTNALIKLLQEKRRLFCVLSGHGEADFRSKEADGYEAARLGLEDQSYEIKVVNLAEEGKISPDCQALAIMGPKKSFFNKEVKLIDDYLADGGRAVIGLDVGIDGKEFGDELSSVLKKWHVGLERALIVDPLSRLLGADAAMPILANYSKDHDITREFKESSYFPFTRPLKVLAGAPAGMDVKWLAKTTPKSWAESGFADFGKGRVKFDSGDQAGPLDVMMAVEGKLKDSKAKDKTRIVVFGTSQFANNNYSRYGQNLDLFLNAVSWAMEDESLISIRAKTEDPGKVELSRSEGNVVFLITVFLFPASVGFRGAWVWWRRRKL